jgi:copper chaperone
MVETILKVQGMMCGMCESHINDVVRKTAQVNKVSSSHTRGETVIVSEQELDIETLKQAIAATGYTVTGAETRPYKKKGFFAFWKK